MINKIIVAVSTKQTTECIHGNTETTGNLLRLGFALARWDREPAVSSDICGPDGRQLWIALCNWISLTIYKEDKLIHRDHAKLTCSSSVDVRGRQTEDMEGGVVLKKTLLVLLLLPNP